MFAPYGTVGTLLMLRSVIEPVIERLPERIFETEHHAAVSHATVERAQILLQAAARALVRSQLCLTKSHRTRTPGTTNVPR